MNHRNGFFVGKLWGLTSLLLALTMLSPFSLLDAKDTKKKEADDTKTVTLARINITGALQDALPQDNPFGTKQINFRSLLNLIEKAAEDDEVSALLLNVNSPAISFAKIRELRDVLIEFKDSGKKIFAYTESCSLKDMTLLSLCDILALPEPGLVAMPGFNIEVMYYKKLFEKVGFKMMVEHVGDYKSAYENMHLDSMSEANREVLGCLLDEFYNAAVSMIADGRGIARETVMMAIDRALLTAKEAHSLGLIDAVMYRDQFDAHLKKEFAVDKVKILKKYGRDSIDLDTTNPLAFMTQLMTALRGKKKEKSDNPKIAVIYAAGPIHSGKNSVDFLSQSPSIGSDTMVKAINDAAKDDTIKAIVLRVDSPGGSGLASDVIWRAECEAMKKKPFIVSMADVAGSGGYYIAMAADVILAEPGTITGSIGVVSALPNIHGALEKLGIKIERLSRGRNASLLSSTTPPDKVDLSILSSYMEKFYWDFVDKVAAGRNMTRDQVHKLAQGRVWTGRQAVENGLVDANGSLRDAIEVARIKAGLSDEDNWEIVESPQPPDFFSSLSGGDAQVRSLIASAFGLTGGTDLIFEAMPGLKDALGNLYSFVKIAREETVLYMMPMEILAQ